MLGVCGGGRLLLDDGDGTEDLVGDVGEDGGASRGDAVLGEEQEQAGEEIVDGGGGGEFFQARGEGGGEVGFGLSGESGMEAAEFRPGCGDRQAAAAAGRTPIVTARRFSIAGVLLHLDLDCGEGGTPHPGCF